MPRYKITKPRYINGKYIHATPKEPAIIELPKGTRTDPGLYTVNEEIPAEIPHHANLGTTGPGSAAEAFSKPQSEGGDKPDGDKPARASDTAI